MNEEEKKLITLNPDDYYDEQVFNKNFEYLDEKIIELDQNKAKLIDGKVPLSQLTIDTELSQDSQAPIGNRFLKIVIDKKADLNENGKIPEEQLPSYVDDVVEYDTYADFPEEGETGKIYVDVETNTTYRWSGSMYVRIGKSYDEDIERIDESIKAIKGTAEGQFIYDTETKMTKVVPDGVNKGIVSMIGGKTQKCKNLWKYGDFVNVLSPDFTVDDSSVSFIGNGKTYTFSLNISGTELGSAFEVQFRNGSNVVKSIQGGKGFISRTFTIDSAVDNIRFYANPATYTNIQLEESTSATDYEPYHEDLWNAPVEKIIITGSNLVEKTIKQSSIDNKGIIISTDMFDSHIVKVISGRKYCINKGGDATVVGFYTSYPSVGSISYDGSRLVQNASPNVVVVTAPITGYMVFRTLVDYAPASCAYGETYYPYKEYHKEEIRIPSEILNLPDYGCSAGDVYNYVDFEEMVYHHRVGSFDMGDRAWAKQTQNNLNTFYINNPNYKLSGNIVCSTYASGTSSQVLSKTDKTIATGTGTNQILFYDSNFESKTAEEVRMLLNGQIINYELSTEELIDISDIVMPFMLESGGTITFENEHNLDVPNTVIYEKEMI